VALLRGNGADGRGAQGRGVEVCSQASEHKLLFAIDQLSRQRTATDHTMTTFNGTDMMFPQNVRHDMILRIALGYRTIRNYSLIFRPETDVTTICTVTTTIFDQS
jgi:hypothetical protein